MRTPEVRLPFGVGRVALDKTAAGSLANALSSMGLPSVLSTGCAFNSLILQRLLADSKSAASDSVRVRVPPSAPTGFKCPVDI